MSNSKREVISQSTGRKNVNGNLYYMEQVVYKIPNGTRTNGKPSFRSETKHEISKVQSRKQKQND